MGIKPITEEQKEVLKSAAAGGEISPTSIYPQPTVQPVDAFGVLHPDTTGVDNVEIIVDYDGMPNNDILSFYWNGDLSIPAVVADTKPKRIPVPAGLVITAANKTINVIYSVIDDANPSGVPSDVHTQVIEKYTPPVYPAPVITEAVGGVLDVGALTQNAHVTVAAWPGIAMGQRIWLSMTSTPPVTLTNWVGFPITSTGAQSTTLNLGKLQTIDDGSNIVLHFEVSFDGGVTKVPFPAQTYTIKQAQLAAPTITSLTDSTGPVLENGTTFDTTVMLSGTVAANQQVEILDGPTSLGNATTNGGTWTNQVTVSVGAHSFTAKGLYGNNPVSSAWRLSVATATAPTITSVRDSKGEVGPGGSTVDTSVTLQGSAANNQQVQIFDGTTPMGTAPVSISGGWTLPLNGLTVKTYSIKATGIYGNNPESAVRMFTVTSPIPQFVVDTSPVTLSAITYMAPTTLPNFPAGSTVSRPASGGVPPYRYISSTPRVADVSAQGLVSVRANGVTTITVSDSGGNSRDFNVTVQNVFAITEPVGAVIWSGAVAYQPAGAHLPSLNELKAITAQYTGKWPFTWSWFWTSTYYDRDLLGDRYYIVAPNGEVSAYLVHFAYQVCSIKPT